MRRLMALALILAGLGAFAPPALAHKLRVFAVAEGDAISGHGFFVGGGRARGVTVSIRLETSPTPSATTTAAADGGFRFEAVGRGAYLVRIDAGDGHVAEARVEVTVGDEGTARAPSGATASAAPEVVAGARAAGPEASVSCLGDAELGDLIAMAVARELRPLREEIAAADARLRLTDIAGGLGMIIGLAGLAMLARARGWIGPKA